MLGLAFFSSVSFLSLRFLDDVRFAGRFCLFFCRNMHNRCSFEFFIFFLSITDRSRLNFQLISIPPFFQIAI